MNGLIAKALAYGGGNSQPIIMSDTLKLVDEAVPLATINLGDWSMVFKKVDTLTRHTVQSIRSDSSSDNWVTKTIEVYAAVCECVYYGDTLKWMNYPDYYWRLSTDYYKFGSLGDETLFWKYYQVRSGMAVGDDDNTTFTENVIRITEVKPLLPSSTSTGGYVGMSVKWLYDEQITNYNYDGSIDNLRYNRGLTDSVGKFFNGVPKEYIVDFENYEKDYANFWKSVMAYVSNS